MQFISPETEIVSGLRFFVSHGHTEAMLIPLIWYRNTTVAFMADLIPSAAHLPVPYVMSYDIRPLDTMKEKKTFLQEAYQNRYVLFFEHDPKIECVTLKQNEKGISAENTLRISEL